MKKSIALVLVLVTILSLTGCVSKEEKAAAADLVVAIDNIGTVTLDSEAAIDSAQAAYDQLSEKAQKLVENYPVLEAAQEELLNVYTSELNKVTDLIEQCDTAMDAYDTVKITQLLEEALPLAEKLEASKYYVGDQELVTTLKNVQDVVIQACYPNTRIISLDNYIKLADISNATADSNEGENFNTDDETGMEYHTYFYNRITQMSNAFLAYTEYLKLYFELDDVSTDSNGAIYTFKDELGRTFYAQWGYYDLGYYGSVSAVYVGFAPEVGLSAALKTE